MDLTPPPHQFTQCDREPIHQIAAIQPFGALIKLNSDWSIGHRSVNCADMLGLEALPALGSNLEDLFTDPAMQALRASLVRLANGQEVDRIFGIALVETAGLFDCAVHCVGERIIIEFEPHDTNEFVNHVAMIGPLIAQLEAVTKVDDMCARAASLVRTILGYDRVMVYKFHPDESGEVIAEDAREDLEPYLGLRYPRADIPRQARAMMVDTKLRMIADVDASLAAIEPPTCFGNRPLNMARSALRAPSEVHLEYLRNMGVRATLTISILRQGKLWGLISCHHTEPKRPSFSLRTVAETLGQMLSLILDRTLIEQSERLRGAGLDLRNQLMVHLADGIGLNRSLAILTRTLDDLIAHDGLTVYLDGAFTRHGAAPDQDELAAIAPSLKAAQIDKAFAVTNIADHIPAASAFADKAAGALFVPISRGPLDYLILWRKPLTKRVRWAGDPSKAKITDPEDRLQPRKSFAAWEETVKGQCEAWSEDDLYIADGLRVTLLEVILQMTEEIGRERQRAQEQQELLIAELNHRVRNILNLIRSLVSQTGHEAIDVESFALVIGGRITALASAHNNITRENWSPAPLHRLFETEVEAYL
ncbi:MAG: HWE histidine kinase domain-containing protein, partial [Pseudomonadota bacterium]